ncbi:MAG: competence/damage-inducible protein A [Caldicoprobacterales bacterium]|jgi:nicotinamide-nucleotide amidase|nr:competence/damage-inducible protein A [Clostridiales bacterium]
MNAEIIGIGSELLLGQIVNTDAQFLSQQLSFMGIDVYWHTVVGDNRSRILEALRMATTRSDIIITTGGLGPTMDDLSKETVAEFLGMELEEHQPSLKRIQNYFQALGRTMSGNNIKQAMFPREAIVLQNDNGTAPGAIIEKNKKVYIILPGPPAELQPMFINHVVPYLTGKTKSGIYSRVLRIFGIGESSVEERIQDLLLEQGNPTIAPLAASGEVKLRITAKASSRQKAEKLIRPVQGEIENRLGNAVYGYDEETMESVVINLLRAKKLRLALAESCTGGHISDLITNIPGASDVFLESCITYSNEAKIARLGVSPDTLMKYGAVSHQTAREMAEGIRKTSGADIGAAITGIAGPGGGTHEKPVGLVYMAITGLTDTQTRELCLGGNRLRIKYGSALHLLNWLRLHLKG